ncbi:MAG TPA: hypothetical protein VN030_15305 [Cellvibrio sp.]|nr:hypothetical protein [Cellvibrio sp.]
MIFLNKIKKCLGITSVCLLCCTACAKTAQEPSSVTQDCEGFNELIKMAISEDMLDLPPDAFIEKYKPLISVTSDETTSSLPSITSRNLTFKATKGDWLVKAEASYDSNSDTAPQKAVLDKGSFSINKRCTPNSKELDARLSQLKPTENYYSPDIDTEYFWQWDYVDPKDVNTRRTTVFRSYKNDTSLIIGRNPNNQDANEGEGEGGVEE